MPTTTPPCATPADCQGAAYPTFGPDYADCAHLNPPSTAPEFVAAYYTSRELVIRHPCCRAVNHIALDGRTPKRLLGIPCPKCGALADFELTWRHTLELAQAHIVYQAAAVQTGQPARIVRASTPEQAQEGLGVWLRGSTPGETVVITTSILPLESACD